MRRNVPLKRGGPLKSTKPPIPGANSGQNSLRSGTPTIARQNALARNPAPSRKAPRDTGPDRATRELVLQRDGYACVCCGVSVIGRPYSLQHRKRRSQGGTSLPSNLITVLGDGTRECHARIDSRCDPHDEAKGYTVRGWGDPALVPVMVFSPGGSGMSLYPTDDGRWSAQAPGAAA